MVECFVCGNRTINNKCLHISFLGARSVQVKCLIKEWPYCFLTKGTVRSLRLSRVCLCMRWPEKWLKLFFLQLWSANNDCTRMFNQVNLLWLFLRFLNCVKSAMITDTDLKKWVIDYSNTYSMILSRSEVNHCTDFFFTSQTKCIVLLKPLKHCDVLNIKQ